jgi:hypothetical protein
MQNISEDTLCDIGGGCAIFLPLDASGMKAVSFTGRRLPYQYFFHALNLCAQSTSTSAKSNE